MTAMKINRPFPIWVLNLERSSDRREYMQQQLKELHWQFEIIPAVDGKCLGSKELKHYSAQQAIKTIGRELTPGEIACALSHAKMWERIIAENIQEVLIFEDDVVIKNELMNVLEWRHTFPADWEYINFRTDVGKIPFGAPVYTEYRVCHFGSYANRTCAYFINIKGAKKLCDHVYPIRLAADGLTGRTYVSDLISYGIYPDLVELANFPSVRSDEISGTSIDDMGREANMPIEQSTSAIGTPPLVSAIVSAYNAERFIQGCLEDLAAQTIAERLEIIVVDSGSQQNEWTIVREFQQRYDNIVYIRTARREGIYAAWNRGIQAARGAYITNANTDDRHKPDAFERMAATLETRPEIALVYADAYMTRTENETFAAHTPVGELNWPDFDPLHLLHRCYVGPQPMWRKSVHTRYGYFDESFEVAGDWEFWLRMAENETFLHIREFLGLYLSSSAGVENRNHELLGQENVRVYQRYADRAGQPPNAEAVSDATVAKPMSIKAYPLYDHAALLQSASDQRAWTQAHEAVYANLALGSANRQGWQLLCPQAFEATWNGGPSAEDIAIRLDAVDGDAPAFVQSNLGGGLLTCYTGYQVQTEVPHSLWVRGPINLPKDGLSPLESIVDTALLPCTITVTWKFTRPNQTIRFEQGEPFGTILPYAGSAQENVTLDLVPLDTDADLDAYEQAVQQLADSAAVQSLFQRLSATPVLGLVFSRDRAMQLDATLRSFHLHCQDPETSRLYVIYKITNQRHAQQYAQLKQEYAAYGYIHFIEETDFCENVMHVLVSSGANGQAEYILFLVDDNIFVRDFSLHEIRETLAEHPEAAGFSLRLGANSTYHYSHDQAQDVPTLTPIREHIRLFDWTTAPGSFNYPLEVSCSVFRSDEMRGLLDQLPFKNPNTLEYFMQRGRSRLRATHPFLLCYEQSVAFCNPVNKVQTTYANRAGTAPEYAADHLAKLFDQGYRIRVVAYAGFVPSACHQEVELIFEQCLAATPATLLPAKHLPDPLTRHPLHRQDEVHTMKITAYPLSNQAVEIAPQPSDRAWASEIGAVAANLALSTVGGQGWDLLCPQAFEATWNGGPNPEDIAIRLDAAEDDAPAFVQSNLGDGLLTCYTGYQIQTEAPHSLWVRGPINLPKDGLYPLESIVDTALLPCTITVTWKFTRPNQTIRFEQGEPFGTILPYAGSAQENVTLDLVPLDADADLDAYEQAVQQLVDNAAVQSLFQRLGSAGAETTDEATDEAATSPSSREATPSRWADQLNDPPPVSCICPTYGRVELLEEAIQSFLQQDYPGQKELIVLNDYAEQILEFEHPEVRIINVPIRFNSVGEKYKAAAGLCTHDLIVVWHDDDIYLSHRLSFSVAHFDPRRGFFKAGSAWFWNDGRLSGPERNTFHGGSCFSRELFIEAQGYPHVGTTYDIGFEVLCEDLRAGATKGHQITPEDVYYIYRWAGTGSYHLSLTGQNGQWRDAIAAHVREQAERGQIKRGQIGLAPHWKTDYAALVRTYLDSGPATPVEAALPFPPPFFVITGPEAMDEATAQQLFRGTYPARISVVLPALNESVLLQRTVEQFEATLPANCEIIVVDNGSNDGSADFLAQRNGTSVSLIQSAKPLGVAGARNRGLAAARGEVVVFADAHIDLPEHWWQPVVATLNRPNVGVVGPGIGIMGQPERKVAYAQRIAEPNLRVEWLGWQQRDPYPVPTLGGGFMAMRRETLECAGGFDPGMPQWGSEDLELCMRYWLLGYEVWVVPDVTILHYFRSENPLKVKPGIVTHNVLRVALLHFNQERIARVVSALKTQGDFGQALAHAVDSDVWQRRAEFAARRARDDDWFFERFKESCPV